jgi:thiosulfate/3-mercaptopyruvate sulfurtransferase
VDGQIAPPERFRETMERTGIGDDTLVVAYDDNVIFMAARLAWCLHHYGHERVRWLEGGFPKWVAEGRAVEASRANAPARASFTPRPRPALRRTKEDVLALVRERHALLFDCRMDRTWLETGAHIPGAARLPAASLLRDDGTLRDAEEIAALAHAAGARPDEPVVLYCGGGVSASAAYLALHTAGFENLSVYDGSWAEWSVDPETPKERH